MHQESREERLLRSIKQGNRQFPLIYRSKSTSINKFLLRYVNPLNSTTVFKIRNFDLFLWTHYLKMLQIIKKVKSLKFLCPTKAFRDLKKNYLSVCICWSSFSKVHSSKESVSLSACAAWKLILFLWKNSLLKITCRRGGGGGGVHRKWWRSRMEIILANKLKTRNRNYSTFAEYNVQYI